MKIFELDIPKLNYTEFLKEITSFLNAGSNERGKIIFTPNPEICLATLEDQEFLQALKQADYLTSDGIGLYLGYQINEFLGPALSPVRRELERGIAWRNIAAIFCFPYFIFNILFRKKHLYKKYGDRICGSDLTYDLVKFAEGNDITIAVLDPYFPEDTEKCLSQKYFVTRMKHKFPKLKLDFYIYKPEDKEDIFKKIRNSDTQILFSTLGMKRQELSVIEAIESCPNLKLGLGVGSSFDYFTGFQKRAPQIWRTLGFEWLYRIFTSPGKLKRLKRIYQAVIIFPLKVLLKK